MLLVASIYLVKFYHVQLFHFRVLPFCFVWYRTLSIPFFDIRGSSWLATLYLEDFLYKRAEIVLAFQLAGCGVTIAALSVDMARGASKNVAGRALSQAPRTGAPFSLTR